MTLPAAVSRLKPEPPRQCGGQRGQESWGTRLFTLSAASTEMTRPCPKSPGPASGELTSTLRGASLLHLWSHPLGPDSAFCCLDRALLSLPALPLCGAPWPSTVLSLPLTTCAAAQPLGGWLGFCREQLFELPTLSTQQALSSNV